MNILRNILSYSKQLRNKPTSFQSRNSEIRKTKQNNKNNLKTYQKDDIRIKRGRYQISNIVVSSKDCGSKKKYWETHSKLKFSLCVVQNCLNRASVGGHVWMKETKFLPWNKSNPTIYIVPLCQVHHTFLINIFCGFYHNLLEKLVKTFSKLNIFVLFTWKM